MKRGNPSRTEPRISLVGNKYHKLTVVSLHSYTQKTPDKNRKITWLCNCDCGTLNVLADHNNLISGFRKSCGCMRKETLEKMWDGNSKEDSFINAILREYKANAQKRSFTFELSREAFLKIITSNCTYCGNSPSNMKKIHIKSVHSKNSFLHNGIDRVDSSIGYTFGNSVPCCKRCNVAKNDMSLDEFKMWINRLYNFLKLNDGTILISA